MRAMVMESVRPVGGPDGPLRLAELPVPEPGWGEIRIRVAACGVCHTELDIIEGRTPPPKLPLVPGHQVVGRVDKSGPGADRFTPGDRVGVAWIFSACGSCAVCIGGLENLCRDFVATGRDADGGYAEFMRVPEAFAHAIPDGVDDAQAAPLLCAGAVGYRAFRLTGLGTRGRLGFTGFGASGHLVLKWVRHCRPDIQPHVFARSAAQRRLALALGAVWARGYDETPPDLLDAVIDTTPAWLPVRKGLETLRPGGRLVINAIRKETADQAVLMDLDYARHLWMEKEIKSVANVTRQDVSEFLRQAVSAGLVPEIETYPLEAANVALMELKNRRVCGAKVLLTQSGG